VAPVGWNQRIRSMKAAQASVAKRHDVGATGRPSIGRHSVPAFRRCDADPRDADAAQES